MRQTCHTGGTWGMVGYLPPGSQLCTTRGSAQSEPGGWYDSRPLSGTPPLGTKATKDVSGKRPCKFGAPPGGGGGYLPGPPDLHHAGSDGA